MSNSTRKPTTLKSFLLRWLPVFLWAAFIFILSSNPDPFRSIPQGIYHWLWWTKLFGQSLFFYVGALGHVIEYAVLALLLARAMLWRVDLSIDQLFRVFSITLILAYLDEFHQIFTPGRAFQVVDLLLDSLGAAIGLGAKLIYFKRAEIKQSRIIQRIQDALLRLKNLKTKPT